MRKLFLILILILVGGTLFSATPSPAFEYYMLGFVNTVVDFSVTILEDVLPFDLEGADVAFNDLYVAGDTGQIKGLRIGEYTLISNSNEFELYIAHTPLILKTAAEGEDTGTLTQIDYRLYAVLGSADLFISALSDNLAATPDTATNRIRIAGDNPNVWTETTSMLSIVRKSLYLSLEDNTSGSTANTVENLKAGRYESNIYFMLKGT